MHCNRLHAWWSTQSRLATLLSSLIARWWFELQTLWQFWLKYLSIDEMVGAWCVGCCQAHRGLPVGFLLLRYSALCTVESLYLLYLLFISWFICSRRLCIYKLGVFHANQTSICLIHIWTNGEVGAPWNRFKPLVKLVTDRSQAVLLLWTFYVISVLFCRAFVRVCLLMPCGHLLGQGWPIGSHLWCLIVKLVSWVRCGAWLYQFLIFALFFTFIREYILKE